MLIKQKKKVINLIKAYIKWKISPILTCPNENDRFTVTTSKKGNKALKYSIGLITAIINIKEDAKISGGIGTSSSPYIIQTP